MYSRCILSFLSVLLLSSCVVYTEKQSQSLSRAVYATRDSFEKARIDLASTYASEAARIVKPPKNKIEISSLYKEIPTLLTANSTGSKNVTKHAKQRILIVPDDYKNDALVTVGSEEYQELLKNKEVFEQLKKDHERALEFKAEVDDELMRQENYANKMVQDLNRMQKELLEKDLSILKRNIIIIVLLAIMGGATYLRIKGIL